MFFKISTPQILAFFLLAFLKIFLNFIVIIQVLQPNRKSVLGFDNKLRENVCGPWISFQLLLSQFLAVLMQLFKFFLKFLVIF